MTITSIIIDDEQHGLNELSGLIERAPAIALMGLFDNLTLALEFLQQEGHIDVIFCDVLMPGFSGIQAAKLLHPYCNFLVYVTAYPHHALDALDVHASGYLLKPVAMEVLMEKINWMIDFRNKREAYDNIIFIKGERKNSFIKINLNEILYVKAMLNYVEIFTKTVKYTTYIGLKAVEQKLNKYRRFRRISKSLLINTHHIVRIEGNSVVLESGQDFIIGESYRDDFHKFMRLRTLNP